MTIATALLSTVMGTYRWWWWKKQQSTFTAMSDDKDERESTCKGEMVAAAAMTMMMIAVVVATKKYNNQHSDKTSLLKCKCIWNRRAVVAEMEEDGGCGCIIWCSCLRDCGETCYFFWKSALDSATMRLFRRHIGCSGRGRMKRTLQMYSWGTRKCVYFNVIFGIIEPVDARVVS